MSVHLLMSTKERERKVVFELVKQGHLNLTEGSKRLGLSYRQMLRSWQRYCNEGDAGLPHKSRGRISNRRLAKETEAAIVDYYVQHLGGFEPTFASEKLALAGWSLPVETLRRVLIRHKLWQPKKRRVKYRRRRERRASFGELVQLDGSFHDWFNDGNKNCLMNMVDDSSSTTLAELHPEETTEAAMRVLWAWIEKYGIPKALYTDKRNVYVTDREPTIEEQLANRKPLTAFGQCCKELGIDIITAHSPQAKGRVERSNGTYQDRFVKEIAYQKIKTIDAANDLLRHSFCDDLNRRFALALKVDSHRPLGRIKLYDMFIWREDRVVSNDWTVRFNNEFYQLKKTDPKLKPKAHVTMIVHIDGKISIRFKGRAIAFEQLKIKPSAKSMKASKPLTSEQRAEFGRRGAKESPWRQFNTDWMKRKKGQPLVHRAHSPNE